MLWGFCTSTQVSKSPPVHPSARYQVVAGVVTPMESWAKVLELASLLPEIATIGLNTLPIYPKACSENGGMTNSKAMKIIAASLHLKDISCITPCPLQAPSRLLERSYTVDPALLSNALLCYQPDCALTK